MFAYLIPLQSPTPDAAFTAGFGMSMGHVQLAILVVLVSLLFAFVTWAVFSLLAGYTSGRIELKSALIYTVRAVLLIFLVMFVFVYS
jgi:integrating conjugative element protein (TIGR03758 family)